MKNILVLFLFYLFAGCGEIKKEGVKIFDFSANIDNYKPFEESNYKLSYEIIPLESTYSSLIHFIERVVMSDRHIYTISEGVNVKIFDRKGKFLKTINHGRANHELIMPNDMIIDEGTGNIIFLDGFNHIKTFDSLGNFIEAKRLDIIAKEMNKIGDRYLFYDGNMSKVDSTFVIMDGDKTNYYLKKLSPKMLFSRSASTHISTYNGDLYFMADFDNVLYKMGKNDKKPVKYAIFNNLLLNEVMGGTEYFALKEKYKGLKFISIDRVRRLNDDLISFSHSPDFLLYDQSTNTPYRHPLSGFLHVCKIQGVYNGKTIHCLAHEYIRKPKDKYTLQSEVLYHQVDEWERKNGVNANPYLILVSYDKKK